MVTLRSNFELKLCLISILLAGFLLTSFIWANLSLNTVNRAIPVYKSPVNKAVSKLEIAQQAWLEQADNLVKAESDKLLAAHGLTSDDIISHPLVIKICRFILGFVTALLISIDKYKKSTINAACATIEIEDRAAEIQQLANEIFVGPICKRVEIVQGTISEAAVCQDYRFDTCYLMLDQSFFSNLSQLRAVLQHEYAHVLYEDKFKIFLLKLTIRLYSKQSVLKQSLETDLYSLMRACETRADIYAAVNSPDHGLKLMEFLEKAESRTVVLIDCDKVIAQFKLGKNGKWASANCAAVEAVTTHPATSDRIKLLKQIKTELDIAAKKKYYK